MQPSLAVLDKPSVEFLKNALSVPTHNLIWQYQKLLEYDGISLTVNDEVLMYIAQEAYNKGTGCRGLRSVCDELFRDIMFVAPDMTEKNVVVDMELVDLLRKKCAYA